MSSYTPAEAILSRLGITEPDEIDLEAIASTQAVRVRYRPLQTCEARIVGTRDQAIVTVNSASNRRRQRFSIAHELGHWHHHRGRLLFCQAGDIGSGEAGPLNPERVADRFASQLLLPNYLFGPIARSYPKADFQTVQTIADLFDVSRTTTAIRLVEDDYFSAALVCHGAGGRKWFTRSPGIPARWFPCNDLAADGFAMNVLFGGAPNDRFPGRSAPTPGSIAGTPIATTCRSKPSGRRKTRS